MIYQLANNIQLLRSRPDFQRAPFSALLRRLLWRLRWCATEKPWSLKLGREMRVLAPHGGAGALIYYQGYSEPETAQFITRYLQPGMVFLDVGAHIGEYTLLASRQVGSSGRIHSFEPQPSTFELLERNVGLNDLGNVTLNACAVSDGEGQVEFVIRPEPSTSSIAVAEGDLDAKGALRRLPVSAISLDLYCARKAVSPDLIKVDVEGAELWVLRGADALLARPAGEAPVWVLEYAPENYSRFGYQFEDLLELLLKREYRIYCPARDLCLTPFTGSSAELVASRNLVASKRPLG